MAGESSKPESNEQLSKLADALGDIRDSLVTVSMALTDLVTETPSPARDEVMVEVERYLCRIREAHKRDFD
jgi:predicted secreted protein